MARVIRIGAGAGFSGDRIEPAADLAREGALDYLVFECLAERTIALAQLARLKDPESGFDALLEARLRAVLKDCIANGTRIITNMGAANPLAAARKAAAVASSMGFPGLKIAAVTGDDVLEAARDAGCGIEETGRTLAETGNALVSVNAYLGAGPVIEALDAGADIVITGRVADPALFLGPLMHEFGWRAGDWEMLGRGALAGHLLECAGQVTGGYFADPGLKDVPDLARLGFPIGIVDEEGGVMITKLAGSGGAVTAACCKEQALYEIGDPANYFQPDVTADFSQVRAEEIAPDSVRLTGARGKPAPEFWKASAGYLDGFTGEGQISYAGAGALARARLAGEIVRERLAMKSWRPRELRIDVIGQDALHGAAARGEPYEARLRVTARAETLEQAEAVAHEVESLYTNGPAGGGGAFKSARPVIAIGSVYLPRGLAKPRVAFFEA